MPHDVDPTNGIAAAVSTLAPISLHDLNRVAALQKRVDRKYILRFEQAGTLVGLLGPKLAVLNVDGRTTFGYDSSYFDSESLGMFWDAAMSRPDRVKVRTRSYLDSERCMLEIKTKKADGTTDKVRQPHPFERRNSLDVDARGFVDHRTGQPGMAAQLVPVLTTIYDRVTLVDVLSAVRLTIDTGLCCADWRDREVRMKDRAIVEVKSVDGESWLDRWMWRHGIYPTRISKYGTGLAALHPQVPADKWDETVRDHFRVPEHRAQTDELAGGAADLLGEIAATVG